MSETVLEYLTRSGFSAIAVLDHYDSGQLQINGEPVTSLDQVKEAADVVSIALPSPPQ